MAVFSVFTLEESNITISGGGQLSGITQGNGSHLVGETITLNNNNWVKVDVDDSNDSNFNDSDNSQTLDAAITYNGTAYAAGLRVETEFGLTVQDPDGNTYTILAFNINEPGVLSFSTVEGLAFVGGVGDFPPIGVPLTVISNQEGLSRPFSSLASPQCFTRGCRIDTPHGPRLIEELCLGDVVTTVDNGPQKILWVNRRMFTESALGNNPKLRPVRIMAGALGNNLPKRDLLVSRQHRMLIRSKLSQRMFGENEVLVPAIKLTKLSGIYVDEHIEEIEYFHLLFEQHEVIYAEGAPTESLFTGPESLKAVSPEAREEILTIFPELRDLDYQPKPARFIPSGKLQKHLIQRHLKNNKPLLHCS